MIKNPHSADIRRRLRKNPQAQLHVFPKRRRPRQAARFACTSEMYAIANEGVGRGVKFGLGGALVRMKNSAKTWFGACWF